jgi:hypothetical protein
MTTVLAVAALALAFVIFAILGPAEGSKPCGGHGPSGPECDTCPLDQAGADGAEACPGQVANG